MNLKFNGLIFVLIVIVDAISGSLVINTTGVSHPVEESSVTPSAEVSPAVGNRATQTVETIKPISSDLISTSSLKPPEKNSVTSTSTTPAPTPAPPTPAPAPERGIWIIRNDTTNITCVIAQMAVQLNVTYPGKVKSEENGIINIPKNASASGNCSDPSQAITISWGPKHSLKISFRENKTTNNYFVSGLDLTLNASVFKDAKDVKGNPFWHFSNTTAEFLTPLQMSYKCSQKQDLNLTSDDPKEPKLKAVLSLKDTQFEAYMNKKKDEFGAAQDCDTFDTPDIVPIAVGCALTVLVLVVLAAYLIGRRRSQSRGYLSM